MRRVSLCYTPVSSTFSAFLRKQMRCEPEGHCCHQPGIPRGSCDATRKCSRIPLCIGHHPLQKEDYDLAGNSSVVPIVTQVREPWSRYLSAFRYPTHHTPGVSLSEHLRIQRWDNVFTKLLLGFQAYEPPGVNITEAMFAVAKQNLESITFVGILEDQEKVC